MSKKLPSFSSVWRKRYCHLENWS